MRKLTLRIGLCLVAILLLPALVAAGAPQMSIPTFTAPQSVSIGQRINLSWAVSNTGIEAAPDGWYEAVYLSFDGQLGCEDTLLGVWSQDVALAPGATCVCTHQVRVAVDEDPMCKAGRPVAAPLISPTVPGPKGVPAYLILQVNPGGAAGTVTRVQPVTLRGSGLVPEAGGE